MSSESALYPQVGPLTEKPDTSVERPAGFLESVESLELCFVTPFDLPVTINETVDLDSYESSLATFAGGTYRVDLDRFVVQPEKTALLNAMRIQYRRRLREWFRGERKTLVVEMESLFATAVSIDGINLDGPRIEIKPMVVIHGIGVGLIIVTIRLGRLDASQLLASTRPEKVVLNLGAPRFGLKYLSGQLSTQDLIHYLILLAYLAGKPDTFSADTIERARENAGTSEGALRSIVAKMNEHRQIYPAFESYPVCLARLSVDTDSMRETIARDAALLRGYVTGDQNWAQKSPEVVSHVVPCGDVSSRGSIAWFMELNGALKAYSNEMSTDYQESVALLFFELDVLLTQRLVLLKSSYYLSSLDRAHGYKQLLQIRENLARVVSEFYSSNLAFKDTTIERLAKLKGRFKIDQLEAESDRLLAGLGDILRVVNEERVLQRQTLLAVVFSAFGVATLTLDYAGLSYKPGDSKVPLLFWTLGGLFVGLGMALLITFALLGRDD